MVQLSTFIHLSLDNTNTFHIILSLLRMANDVTIDYMAKVHRLPESQAHLSFTPEEHSEFLGLTYLSLGAWVCWPNLLCAPF